MAAAFARGPRGGGFGEEFRAGRKLGSADLQLLILALLADKPSHGYELIKRLEERSGGFYAPSPGVIYPALTYLEEIGHASVTQEGAKKLYTLTEEGRAHVERNRAHADAMLAQMRRIAERMGDVRRAFAGEEREGGSDEMRAAWRALRALVRDQQRGSADEQRRILAILRKAADDIAAGPSQ